MNYKAIDLGATAYKKIDVPADWADAVDETEHQRAGGQAGAGEDGQGDPGARGQDGRRQPARFRLRRSCGRPVRAGRLRL